jgi:Lrp/AsnC family leucine-responsive transcriptional regulator
LPDNYNGPNIFSTGAFGVPLDDIDLNLINALQHDASQRLEALAKLVKMAPSSVHERLRRLQREGILLRWTIDLDPTALGLGVLAFVGVRASRACADLVKALEPIEAIEEFHSVAGELNMLLKVRVESTSALLGLIERVRQIPGIESTETTIVLKTPIDRPMHVRVPTREAKTKAKSRLSKGHR